MFKSLISAGILSISSGIAAAADLPGPARNGAFLSPSAESVLLGRDLFFDPVLSGNRNISCATCHHPAPGSTDAVLRSIGEGGIGPGARRVTGPANPSRARAPRNATALFNLGAREFTTLFHDGRVQRDAQAVRGPLGAQVALAITSHDEMAGQPGENPIADAVAAGNIEGQTGALQSLVDRVETIPDYKRRFTWLGGSVARLHVSDIANAIADFIAFEFRSTDSPFDAFLRGDDAALSNEQLRGMSLFYGKAGCANCHSGVFQTDHAFHAIGIPPIGPGMGHGPEGHADHGRAAVTGSADDLYRFRTPSLRNVTLTAPYGHNGAYARLEDIVRHHLDPLTWLAEYTVEKASLQDRDLPDTETAALEDFDEMLRIAMAVEMEPIPLSEAEVRAILAFLSALEDPIAARGRLGVPDAVPSGLPLDMLAGAENDTGLATSNY